MLRSPSLIGLVTLGMALLVSAAATQDAKKDKDEKKEPPKVKEKEKDKKNDKTGAEDAKAAVAAVQIRGLTLACDAYRIKNGEYPDSLAALTEKDAKGVIYVEDPKVLIDPWKKPYQYDPAGGKNRGRHADIWTISPSGMEIGNWPKKDENKDAEKGKGADQGKELKVLARADWPFAKADPDAPKKSDHSVIRNATELTTRSPWSELDALPKVVEKTATAAVAKLLTVPNIDWEKQMLIVVTAGSKPTGGWKVTIDSVKVHGKTLKVEWSATPPDGIATQAFTHPGQVILVERFDGPVMFVEKTKKEKTP